MSGMIIKKLELQGFKSFADRTKIAFHPGITAVVGPNGTGKSNLVDGMLWVIGGLRSKTVRGDRTDDVIFNGNAKKPALNMADVVLTLAGDDEELVISHRVFRSGESEYRMNGKTVRLKDIQDELWRHAIGEKEYFVIEQGAIGNFVTSKPNEKRLFIEEAAGTAYYKDKKRQAQNKLESTEQNLVRLEDIIIEVDKAKNSLQRQAQAANRYRRLRERIRELTSEHYRRKLIHLEASQKEAAALYDAALAREKDITSRVREEEKLMASRRKELWDLETGLKEGQERLYALRSQIARLEGDIERESKRVEFLEEKKKRDEADRDELLTDVLHLARELEEADGLLAGLSGTLDANRSEVGEAEEALRGARDARSAEASSIGRLRDDYFAAIQELTEIRNETARTEKEIELLARQEDKLAAQLNAQDRLIEDDRARSAGLESEADELRAARGSAGRALDELRSSAENLGGELEGLRSRADDLRARRDEAAHHLEALRRIEDKQRAESPAAEVPGALGLLADIIRTSPENAPLFDAFWREESRARVVPAEVFLRGLPDGLVGSYLLVPLKARPMIDEDVLRRPGVLGLLKSRLEPSGTEADGLAGLEDAVVVDCVATAVAIWAERPELSFLTPGGDLLLSSGLLKLGQRTEGFVALAAEIRKLAEDVDGLESELGPLTEALEAKAREKQAVDGQASAAAEALARADRAVQDKERDLRASLAESERNAATRDLIGRELELLGAEKERLTRADEAGRLGREEREARIRSVKDEIEVRERTLSGLAEEAGRKERAFFEKKSGLDLLQEKINGLRAQALGIGRRKEAAEAKIGQLEEDARRCEADKEDLTGQIRGLRDRLKSLGEELARSEAGLATTHEALEKARATLEEFEASLGRSRGEEEAAKDERVRREIRKAEIDRDLVNLDEMCWQELKKTLAEVRTETASAAAPDGSSGAEGEPEPGPEAEGSDEDADEEGEEAEEAAPGSAGQAAADGRPAPAPKPRRSTKKWRPVADMADDEVEGELEDSREAFNRFKAVNLMAEEEYVEQKTRYDFLVQQRQDLRDSINSTQEAIRKIDEESKTQFLKALGEVNRNFQEIFSSLFKGGNAEVKLLEPESPLESGVEIVAQPPGKRVQNLSLLSGGEKSLTSLAFLFALFRYRPSPFCFLDEVDAALDDVNLARFLDLLKTIKGQTQFILITHNYKTMEVADYIYGTTMPDPNMTKLLSVKLEKKSGPEAGRSAE